MEYRRIGRSGLRVSSVGLGSWLTYGGTVDQETSNACLRRAYEAGVNFFDTADVYGHGEAERVLGRWLAEVDRRSVVVATKVFFPMGPGPNDRGLSRKHIVESCHASLERLGTDYVDLYQCHRFDSDVPLDETLRALDDLIEWGDVLHVGVSEWSAEQLDAAAEIQAGLGLRPLTSNQPQYSLIARGIEEAVLPTSIRLGIGQVVWSPLAGGALTGKYRPGGEPPPGSRAANPKTGQFMTRALAPDVLEAVSRLETEVAGPAGVTLAQLALAWVLARDGVASAIVGATRPEQVDENLVAAGVRLDEGTLRQVEEIMGPFATRGQALG